MRLYILTFLGVLFFVLSGFNLSVSAAFSQAQQAAALASQLNLAQDDAFKRLLHYDGDKSLVKQNSPFFLSSDGYYNPEAELQATLQAFYKNDPLDDRHALCRYPARFSYLQKQLNLSRSDFPKPNCKQYKEFRQKVPAQSVSLVFAAENNTSPSSMMGHLFLKLSGEKEGRPVEHAFSFFAKFPEQSSITFYANALLGNVDGTYILSPYSLKVSDYVFGEERPLWEFEISMNEDEKEQLLNHIWELKEKDIQYAFISNNCGKASVNLLQVAKPEIKVSQKPFQTPLGFIKHLNGQRVIQDISLIPSDTYAQKMQKGIKNILDSKGSSRLSLYYRHLNGSYTLLSFMPVYMDMIDPAPGYYDALESKIMTINAAYRPSNGHFFIDSIDVLKLKSIIDASRHFAFSKEFKFSLENDLGEDKTHVRPTLEAGLGVGYEILNGITPYILPKLGYRYNHFHNFYLTPEMGIIINPSERVRVMASYAPYLNTKSQNRGFDSEFATSTSFMFYENYSLFVQFNIYKDTDIKQKHEFIIGVSSSF